MTTKENENKWALLMHINTHVKEVTKYFHNTEVKVA
jgi:hypothetical protein